MPNLPASIGTTEVADAYKKARSSRSGWVIEMLPNKLFGNVYRGEFPHNTVGSPPSESEKNICDGDLLLLGQCSWLLLLV